MHAHSMMKVDQRSSDNLCSKFCIIVGDYSGHMGFATDPLFCMAYPLSFVNTDDPTQMTFRSQQNHPTFFTANTLLVHQLLTRDFPLCEYAMDRCHRCLLIPKGVHFSHDLFPQIIVPCDHAAPYCDPRSGEEVPFFTIGPFASMDTLFPGTVGDLDLFTDEEVIALTNVGVFRSAITSASTPQSPSLASRMEPVLSARKQDYRDSPSHRCPVTAAARSHEDLGKSEHEHEAARKQLHCGIDTECGHTTSRDLTHGCMARDEHGPMLKSGRSIDMGASGEHPHPKEQWAERGRSHERRRINLPERPPPPPFLFTPMAPCCPITGSLCALSLDRSRGSLPLDRGVDTEVSVSSAGMVTPSSACQLVQGSGQFANKQVDPILATSGLTAATV